MSVIASEITEAQDKDGMLRRALERLIQLYTDKSHFLYELLQNAEDAEATQIKFVQYDDRLEVYHDGKPFSKANLQGLCDIGKSDKVENYNQIGEFGVGFKSVFSICETVELYSEPANYRGDAPDAAPAFAVRIENFTDATDIAPSAMDSSFTTKFVFPYAVGYQFSGFKTIQDLKNRVSAKLQNLGITTLLFMKHLEVIGYEIKFANYELNGEYLLEKKEINDHCLLVSALGRNSSVNKGKDEEISYLKYSRSVDADSTRTVDIAFPVIQRGENDFECRKPKSPYISVYFPTETKSELDFIVQGPYRTTPNRSSIPADDIDNISLAKETAILLIDTLNELRGNGWLNMSFIKALPLSESAFESYDLFCPLYDAVRKFFSNPAIPSIPTKEGNYVSARFAKIVRNENLLELFNDDLLTELMRQGTRYQWLPTCLTETNKEYMHVYKYFVNELKIAVIRPENLRNLLEENPYFLPNRSDSWLVQFYGILENVHSVFDKKSKEPNYLTTEIVKTSTGDFIAPYRRTENNLFIPNVYLPSEKVNNSDICFVDENIYLQSRHFFEEILRLHQPDEYKFFVTDIKNRYSENYTFEESRHIDDIKRLFKFLNSAEHKEEIESIIKDIFLVRCTDGRMRNPYMMKIYLPKNGDIYLEGYLQNISRNVYFVDLEFYSNHGVDASVLTALGAIGSLLRNEDTKEGEYVTGNRGRNPRWECSAGFRWKLNIEYLKKALLYIANNPSARDSYIKSKTIYSILMENESKLSGTVYIKSTVIDDKENEVCDLVKLLRGEWREGSSVKWLYDKSNKLVAQRDIARQDLNPDIYGKIRQDSIVYELLGFKKSSSDIVAELMKKATREQLDSYFEEEMHRRFGLSPAMLAERLKVEGDEAVDNSKESPILEFPSARVKNWKALKKHAAEVLFFAEPIKYEYVQRHIRTSNNAGGNREYLLSIYRYEGLPKYACQMCHGSTSNIEACQIFDEMENELAPCHLSLCPHCANKYRTMRRVKSAMNQFRHQINSISESKIGESEPVRFKVMEAEIWFTQIHIAEIKELLHLESAPKD